MGLGGYLIGFLLSLRLVRKLGFLFPWRSHGAGDILVAQHTQDISGRLSACSKKLLYKTDFDIGDGGEIM